MPRGGERVGSGRKGKGAAILSLHGGRDRKPPQVTSTEPFPAVEAPEDLSEPAKAVWDRLSPHALAQHTLTGSEAFAFGELCEAIVLKRLMLAEILTDGLSQSKVTLQMDDTGGGLQSVEKKPHALLSNYRGMMQRVEAGLSRFRLAPMGKELVVPAKVEDPFAEFESEAM